ncbi:putative dolichol-phosphate mannosyltransferase [Dictyocoela roeselum]|nr:putative dolichol-phosphate mannosyltransferase [Dictyocoela roeselum]
MALKHTYYPFVVIMDGDLSHDPSYIIDFMKHDSDIVISTRYGHNYKNYVGDREDKRYTINNDTQKLMHLPSGTCGWPFKRKLTSRIANNIVQTLLNLSYSDLTGSYRLYKRKSLEKIINNIDSNGFNFQIEVMFYANMHKLKVTEQPIIFYERVYSSSKLGITEYYGFMKVIFKLMVTRLLSWFK